MDSDTDTPLPLATNMFPPLLPPMVSIKSTKDLLMPNPRLMQMPLSTMVDTMAIPDTDTDTDTDTVLDMVVTTAMADMDTVVSATTVNLYDVVKNQWQGHEPLFPCR